MYIYSAKLIYKITSTFDKLAPFQYRKRNQLCLVNFNQKVTFDIAKFAKIYIACKSEHVKDNLEKW